MCHGAGHNWYDCSEDKVTSKTPEGKRMSQKATFSNFMRFDAKDQKWIGVIFKLCPLARYEGKTNNDQVVEAVGVLHYCTVNVVGELIKVMMKTICNCPCIPSN